MGGDSPQRRKLDQKKVCLATLCHPRFLHANSPMHRQDVCKKWAWHRVAKFTFFGPIYAFVGSSHHGNSALGNASSAPSVHCSASAQQPQGSGPWSLPRAGVGVQFSTAPGIRPRAQRGPWPWLTAALALMPTPQAHGRAQAARARAWACSCSRNMGVGLSTIRSPSKVG